MGCRFQLSDIAAITSSSIGAQGLGKLDSRVELEIAVREKSVPLSRCGDQLWYRALREGLRPVIVRGYPVRARPQSFSGLELSYNDLLRVSDDDVLEDYESCGSSVSEALTSPTHSDTGNSTTEVYPNSHGDVVVILRRVLRWLEHDWQSGGDGTHFVEDLLYSNASFDNDHVSRRPQQQQATNSVAQAGLTAQASPVSKGSNSGGKRRLKLPHRANRHDDDSDGEEEGLPPRKKPCKRLDSDVKFACPLWIKDPIKHRRCGG
ncbi:unnamed protein product [Parascedosporium putredinis]|uniref:Uncharacterized protein n=1 Tax=Parascedosporium putredinis TaxID=1442378 RepID=A0A9P1H556_9PEZI|nr:unnamed protein product [Parascedosporium putredinis]CAI7997496.1 unnamed protein product [Parascedosporium putredinis]